jgi:hypothetical protein
MVGLLGRVVSPSQGLYLHRTTQHRKTRTNIHALSGIGTHDPSNLQAKTPRLRPHGHCDRQSWSISVQNNLFFTLNKSDFLSWRKIKYNILKTVSHSCSFSVFYKPSKIGCHFSTKVSRCLLSNRFVSAIYTNIETKESPQRTHSENVKYNFRFLILQRSYLFYPLWTARLRTRTHTHTNTTEVVGRMSVCSMEHLWACISFNIERGPPHQPPMIRGQRFKNQKGSFLITTKSWAFQLIYSWCQGEGVGQS